MQYSNRTPIVPTYKRPEHLARIVRLLNEYYVWMADVEEWEAEARALREEYKLLGKCLTDLRAEPPLRMVAGYGTERIQHSTTSEPLLMSILNWDNQYTEIVKQRQEYLERARDLEEESTKQRVKWRRVINALESLTPIQKEVIEARHRWGIKVLTLSRSLHYERASLSCEYHRAINKLASMI